MGIACLHAVANCSNSVALGEGAPLDSFVRAHEGASPEERGRALLKEPALRGASDAAASSQAVQTALPARDGPPLDHHFAAFVHSQSGRLVELDGTKLGPIDHGATSAESFLVDAASVMQNNFVGVDPDVHGFAFMALTKFSTQGSIA